MSHRVRTVRCMSSTPTAASTAPLRFDRVVASVNRFEGLAGPDASAVVDTTTEDSGSVRSLQSAIDHLAGPLAARPEAALAEAGLHEVRSYRITVGGETLNGDTNFGTSNNPFGYGEKRSF